MHTIVVYIFTQQYECACVAKGSIGAFLAFNGCHGISAVISWCTGEADLLAGSRLLHQKKGGDGRKRLLVIPRVLETVRQSRYHRQKTNYEKNRTYHVSRSAARSVV
jgi:hypothetical protein